ncbi:MAG: hypothetical protein A2020_03880 [Lentisphaerae bacterium GWF2_45_14]|nr:MAG: hypothetical protein A2020_03880 [Lentisphaerae bacterium GWF2_45_14]
MSSSDASVIIPGTVINGRISGSTPLRLEGEMKGIIDISSDIMVGQNGIMEGDVIANNIMVEGRLSGKASGRECIVIAPSGQVKAELTAPAVSIEKGAKFSGKIDMIES